MKRLYCDILVLYKAFVMLFNLLGDFHCVACSTTSLGLKRSAKAKSLCSAARVGSLVASIDEFWFLCMVAAVG
jgi:hypothetical protein